jgi:SOS response regulatory protein OraA/RecX
VELDGTPWRTMPAEVILRAGLAPGRELDRPLARKLRRELRRHEALALSTRALRHRDLTVRALDQRLSRRGVAPVQRAEVIETLARVRVLDDERAAGLRARALCERGQGNAAIRFALEREGVGAEDVERVLAELPPELQRAQAVVARRGAGPKVARLLAQRGFGEDAVEAALEADVAPGP